MLSIPSLKRFVVTVLGLTHAGERASEDSLAARCGQVTQCKPMKCEYMGEKDTGGFPRKSCVPERWLVPLLHLI